jgi:hypothetical protein
VKSIYRLTTSWTIEGSEFESPLSKEIYLLRVVQTGSGAQPVSIQWVPGPYLLWGKAAGA